MLLVIMSNKKLLYNDWISQYLEVKPSMVYVLHCISVQYYKCFRILDCGDFDIGLQRFAEILDCGDLTSDIMKMRFIYFYTVILHPGMPAFGMS